MKKFLSILSIILLSSCNNNVSIPEDIRNFINAVDFRVALNNITEGRFIQNYIDYNEDVIYGSNSIAFWFNKDEDNFNFSAKYEYSGTEVKDDLVKKEISLTFIDVEQYQFIIKENDKEISSKTINYEEAYGMFYKIYDSGTNSYRVGGLYYGDFFAINMNKFYGLYSLNDDSSILTMKEDNASYYDNITLDQEISIDKNGMLLSKKEKASINDSSRKGELSQHCSYTYNI